MSLNNSRKQRLQNAVSNWKQRIINERAAAEAEAARVAEEKRIAAETEAAALAATAEAQAIAAAETKKLEAATYTDTALASLVHSAPATLDTLNELAAALGDDPNFATTVSNNIATKVSKSGDTMTGTLIINNANANDGLRLNGTSPTIAFNDTDHDSFYLHANSNNFYVLADRDGTGGYGGWEAQHPLCLEADTGVGLLFGNRMFADNYHPNADKWTTARTLTLNGKTNGSVSWDGSGNVTLTTTLASTVTDQVSDITSHDWNTFMDGTESSWACVLNHSGANRPSGAYTYGTALSFGKSGQAGLQLYAPETASAGNANGGIWYRTKWNTAYKPWARVWDSAYMGSGSGLDADTVDGLQGSQFLRSDADDSTSGALSVGGYLYVNTSIQEGLTINHDQVWNPNGNLHFQYSSSGNIDMNYGGGYTFSRTSIRAPIFYDSNNTAYYVNPANDSILDGLRLKGVNNQASGSDYILWVEKPNGNDWGIGITGQQDYNILYDGASSHTYGIRGLKAGAEYFRVGTDMAYHNSRMQAPIFYDANDTAYHLDPNSNSNLNQIRTTGHISVGSLGDSSPATVDTGARITFGSLTTDAVNNYSIGTKLENYGGNYNKLDLAFHTGIRLGAHPNYGGVRFFADQTMGTEIASIGKSGNYILGNNSVRSPIFYDSNDTAYYQDPNSTSRMNSARFNSLFVDDGSYAQLVVGDTAKNGDMYDVERPTLQLRGGQYPHLTLEGTYVNGGGRSTNSNHGPVISFLSNLNNTGYRRWTMGAPSYNASALSWGYYDNNANPHYGVGGDLGYTSYNSKMWLNTGGNLQTTGSMRSPIFYDSNDTNYYVNPNGNSRLKILNISLGTTGEIARIEGPAGQYIYTGVDGSGQFIEQVGTAAANRKLRIQTSDGSNGYTQLFFDGANYNIYTTAGRNFIVGQSSVSYTSMDNTPVVGVATTNRLHVNGSIQLTNNNDAIVFGRGTSSFMKDEELGFGWGGGWYMTDGTYLRSRNNKTVYSGGDAQFAAYYDSNDTAYYVNPNGMSRLSRLTLGVSAYTGIMQHGAMSIGDTSSNYKYTGGWSSSMQGGILANCADNWEFIIHDSGHALASAFCYNGGASGRNFEIGRDLGWGNMYTTIHQSTRTPIVYDSNNTGYYSDPASTSRMNVVNANSYLQNGQPLEAGAKNGIFWENDTTITSNYTISSGKNAGTFGPVTIASNVVVTVPDGSTWTIV